MKMQNKYYIKLFIIALFIMLSSNFSLSKDIEKEEVGAKQETQFSENEVQNLINGIKSNNLGLRRSSIFFAGKYEISKTVDILLEELQKEKDAGTKVLIALSLFKIGDAKAINKIRDMAINDGNAKVRNMFSAIYNEFVILSSNRTAKK